ncbi:hypothetical protein Rsub_00699 [Raphidocelis subcapitata]|uniref:CHK kinase-like domain-containing protein n=1 Tax=Raphidocelis subcapitata TaxID=307507 RepID=A0A2V0NST4_9CHLO|nr:hypothetical protein Rsub_00699 [Raphidocelis subcapitata]|eukprot:GBF87987.1 hypothetical protein Rsub_00699 [Raphidocelis subcapitata]
MVTAAKRPPPNWQRLLAGGGSGGGGGGGGADGDAPPPPLLRIEERPLARLWAGYGSIKELIVTQPPAPGGSGGGGGGGGGGVRRLVAKSVDPPRGKAGDAGHQRKLRSYAVEAEFYRECAPRLAALAASLGLDPRRPAASDRAAAASDAASDPFSWCWTPEAYVIEAEPPDHFLFVMSDLRQQFPQQPHSYDLEEAKLALEWLASFHAAWWEEEQPEGLWEDGCYWHLATRQEELQQIGGTWGELRRAAAPVDEALRGGSGGGGRGGGGGGGRFVTLCHGDAKSANFMFSSDGRAAAAYDYQYCGSGYGTKDVAYLLISSADEDTLREHEGALLDHYHAALTARLARLGKAEAARAFTRRVLGVHYDLALVDFCRFMAGWGFWGAAGYAKARCREVLGRLPAALAAAAAAAEGRPL